MLHKILSLCYLLLYIVYSLFVFIFASHYSETDKQHYSTTTHCHGSYAFARLSCCNVSNVLQSQNKNQMQVKIR
nr:MAG TPA: hypothetical protein [Caudoviricetes sp.]